MRIIAVTALFLAGCNKPNPHYCDPVNNSDCPPQPCSTSSGTCVCKNPPGVCVMCTSMEHDTCKGKTPTCGADNVCHACRMNDDCDSGACLEDGQCADKNKVIYAAPSGVNNPGCGTTEGQNECSITQAIMELGSRTVIRLGPGTYTVSGPDGLDFNGKNATVVARGAIVKNLGGAIMTARQGGSLKLIGGTLQGANNADGLRCNTGGKLQVHETMIENMTQSGIETDSCELTVWRATLRGNLDGGLSMLNTPKIASIVNNFVYRNGSNTSVVGGMNVQLAAGSALEFNTVVSNAANTNSGSSGGVTCNDNNSGQNRPGNLIYRNQGGLGGTVQIIGTCMFVNSYVMAAGAIDENVVGFVEPNATNPDFHLSHASPSGTILDKLPCSGPEDIDGDPRPQPTGGMCDFGADEYREGQ